jgi:PadR family transcriptional regulator PadR
MSMRESTYFVLAALIDERRHGYAIIKKVEELSGSRVRLATGTLYAALERLSAEGYVAADGEEIVGGRARRYYTLTERGSAALRSEAVRMAAAAKVVTEHGSGRAARVRPEAGPA